MRNFFKCICCTGSDLRNFMQLPDQVICGLILDWHVKSSGKTGEARLDNLVPQLENARKLRGICFIDLEEGEFSGCCGESDIVVPN